MFLLSNIGEFHQKRIEVGSFLIVLIPFNFFSNIFDHLIIWIHIRSCPVFHILLDQFFHRCLVIALVNDHIMAANAGQKRLRPSEFEIFQFFANFVPMFWFHMHKTWYQGRRNFWMLEWVQFARNSHFYNLSSRVWPKKLTFRVIFGKEIWGYFRQKRTK